MSISGISSGTGTPPSGVASAHPRAAALHAFHRGGMKAAAAYLNLTPQQLEQDLQSGQTLGGLATTNGGTLHGVAQAFINGAANGVQQLQSNGTITQSQGIDLINAETQRINGLLTSQGGSPISGPITPDSSPGSTGQIVNATA